jgi:hypothetical protein
MAVGALKPTWEPYTHKLACIRGINARSYLRSNRRKTEALNSKLLL